MAIKINFDATYNPESPTLILARRNGDKLGQLNAKAIEITDFMNEASEIAFNVYKYIDNKKDPLWDEITDFKLVYCIEWDTWFEATIEIDESLETMKTVFCTRLGQAELSQTMLYTIEINTENDILREEYVLPTVLYNAEHPESSLLHRIMEKVPHYSISHVDDTIKNIQRTFTFDDISVYDAFQEIAEEIHCLFVFNSNSDKNGNIQRTISVYDLESNCMECGHRDEFTGVCPKCHSKNINEGYGNDTTIFITSDKIADNIQLVTNTESIKNCFKIEAGDDLLTATVRNCNPNGTEYIWYFSDEMKNEMSKELVEKLNSYDGLYVDYRDNYNVELDSNIIIQYNQIVRKYQVYKNKLEEIKMPIVGYSSLMNAYYNTIDLEWYLQSELMPDASMNDTNAQKEALKLTSVNLSPVATTNASYVSLATADSAVLAMAKIIVDSRYKVKVEKSSLTKVYDKVWSWRGSFSVVNYSDDEDNAISQTIDIEINDNYKKYIEQKLDKSLNKGDVKDLSISGLFKLEYNDFVNELKKYALKPLISFHDACQACIDILIEQDISNGATWSGQNPNLYNDLYVPYFQKLSAIEAEMKVRQNEINLITGIYNESDELITYGLQNYIEDIQLCVQKQLDFEEYLGSDLWIEFCSFRRESKYSNDNYISDGLNNAELFTSARELIEVANKEIRKSAELQHSIEAALRNLLVIKEFKPLVKDFQIGNWIRVMIDDEVYKLRLIEYSIHFDDLNEMSVTFSDVVKNNSSIKSVQEVIAQASSMATSYESVKRQAKKGEQSNSIINGWFANGLDATNTKIIGGADNQTQTWDEHGMLFRSYDSILNEYSPAQLKIINSTIAITDDNWESTKTAFGNFEYVDPETGEMRNTYGIHGEVIIGKLMLGERLGIYNSKGSLTFDENGLAVSNDINTVTITPSNDTSIFNIKNKDGNVLSFDEQGNLLITGDIIARSLTLLGGSQASGGNIKGFANVALTGDYNDLKNRPNFATIATSGSYNDLKDTPKFADVATSGDYNDLKNKPEPIDISGKFENPTNNDSSVIGQYLSKTDNGSIWTNAETMIFDNSLSPVCGKAVYDFALSKQQDVNNANKLFYIGSDGVTTFISIDELKALLGVQESV